ncbi:phosphoribosyltransferase [Streptomyces sp. MUM 203J]|uniref:phosphoribosyltransferase family protein n=1 Tax=Streptomyces sp. MUM 203J TaxID=2791990 RepID=UPI001F03D039|nr:phosphoribosyltransferase family protein [Streptomyces sp. MUM 203J]MCH0538924.1 phosphoribosyltransferase [Streptomyces sp. MUM 203J]
MQFPDRVSAGRRLADAVARLPLDDPVVLGLPRGGVPVAHEVATALGAPLDVIVVRKLGVPTRPELGFGAIGEGGVRVVNDSVVQAARLRGPDMARVEEAERAVLEQRLRRYRGQRAAVPLAGRTAVLVDDGIATGSTALVACEVARAQGAARVVVAVPVAPPDALALLRSEADEVVCLSAPALFSAVGQWYDDFSQTSDEEVADLLARHADAPPPGGTGSARPEAVVLDVGGVRLDGDLTVPGGTPGVVVFAHGSGSSRRSPRNRAVARALNEHGLGTLLFDLLTEAEGQDRDLVFDIPLLGRRLAGATGWLRRTRGVLPVCYFGASTGAAAALTAAADPDADIAAVVSRGGRPDLADPVLPDVRAPTLLIVGGADAAVLPLNRRAAERMRCVHAVEVVPGAGHLFEEPGAMRQVEELATGWFLRHLPPAGPDAGAEGRAGGAP